MNGVASYIVESTLMAIIVAWVLTHASQFNTIVTATREASVGSVQALWAR